MEKLFYENPLPEYVLSCGGSTDQMEVKRKTPSLSLDYLHLYLAGEDPNPK